MLWVLIVLGVLVLFFILLATSERFLRLFGAALARIIYRVRAYDVEHLPKGGCLLLPNHVTYVDAIVLQLACPRPIRFLVVDSIYNLPFLKPVLRCAKAIPISSTHAREAIRAAVEGLRQGEVVCLFPEGELTRTGTLLKLKKGFEIIARTANVPVVPVWLDELWGSVFSYERGRFFSKLPKRLPYTVSVAFGKPIPAEQATVPVVREQLMQLGEFCFQKRPFLSGHLGRACVRGLRKNQWRTLVVDGMDNSSLQGGMVLAVGIVLARFIRRTIPDNRVAIVLPPGKGAVLANLGVLLADKIPVNLNFTAGRAALESAIARGDIQEALTAGLVEKKLENFPWPEHIHYLEKMMPPLKKQILLWRILVAILPAAILIRILRLPESGDRREAVLLFTSGSSGEPKGVVLSHRNILGNVSQFGTMLNLTKKDALLASLPFFHSFGCTVTLWYPLIEGVRTVTFTSPLDAAKNADLTEKHRVTMLLATPTFLRGYLRKVKPEQLTSVQLLVTGAEKLPKDLADKFQDKFGIPIMEGYGLTETSPVVSVNLPPPVATATQSVQPSARFGSVGKIAPGMAAQIRDPDTGELMEMTATGMLWLRGPNIFEGYLHEPAKTAEVIVDGWFKTGDLARFDEDGFLYIEGRLSRFSKIGGEMVPHETIENAVVEVLDMPEDDARCVVVVGVPDEAKGEALVLLTTREIDPAELRVKLQAAGFSNLFIPRIIHKIDTIPLLGSGKLDIKACKQMAEDAV